MFRAVTKSSESCLEREKQERIFRTSCYKKRTKKAKTIGIASIACSLNRVKASKIKGKDGGRSGPPINAFYTTVRNVRYQSVSAAISATRDKQSRVQSRVNLKLRTKNALRG